LRANGCPWNEETCSFAAVGGHHDVLKWAIKNGCPNSDDSESETSDANSESEFESEYVSESE
jgi:hypothetical protein